MSKELEKHRRALAVACAFMTRWEVSHLTVDVLKEIHAILNPPPVMEEVEVVRWLCLYCGVTTMHGGEEPPDGNYCCKNHVGHTKLTGSYQRPVPQKVEKSVEFSVRWERHGGIVFPCACDCNADIHALEGKVGTLAFNWEE